ncbi:MAG: hypothetical protein LBV78_20300 [Kitasatospora sp.]|jgi:hypothetical protein|nr:hypothetical protein [Kitasatospora sp.]
MAWWVSDLTPDRIAAEVLIEYRAKQRRPHRADRSADRTDRSTHCTAETRKE